MTAAIALRPDLNITLGDLIEDKASSRSSTQHTDLSIDRLRVDAEASNPFIALGDTEVPMTSTGMEALADHLQVPAPFFKRLGQSGADRQASLLTMLLNDTRGGVVRVEYTDGGLVGLSDPERQSILPVQLLRVADNVLGSHDAPVQRLVDTASEFSFDVHVPLNSDRGVGGDFSSEVEVPEALLGYSWTTNAPVSRDNRVGDITAGGLRMHLDMKRGLSPSVQPFLFRLACTNGMETTTELTKVDARGMSVDEVLADINAKAELAFSRVEREMEHFYNMRDTRVENPERRLRAIARERGIPDRSLMRMLDSAPEALGDSPSEFDVVNHLTNAANHSAVRNDGGRLLLERAGGAVVNDHAARCSRCHHALVH